MEIRVICISFFTFLNTFSLKACLFLVRAICNPDKRNILYGKNSVQKRLKPVKIA